MKKILFLFLFILIWNISFSQTNNCDLNGLWTDSNSAAFKNGYVIYSQEGKKITFSHYLEFNGTSMVEYGKGKVKGNKVECKVKVSKVIPGWATGGVHSMILSPDQKTLRGIYKDCKGNSGPLVFKRIR